MKRCVIIGGAGIEKPQEILPALDPAGDFYILCDCGMRHCAPLGIKPDLIVGDFDSSENPLLPVETIVLPHVKDDTDTMYAVKEALRRGFKDFLLLGVVGGRLDHTLANVYILQYLKNRGCRALIIDDYSEMELVGSEHAFIGPQYPYFSLVNICGTAKGLHIKGAFYNLDGQSIETEYQYGVSNEPLPGTTAEVWADEGCVLLIRDRV